MDCAASLVIVSRARSAASLATSAERIRSSAALYSNCVADDTRPATSILAKLVPTVARVFETKVCTVLNVSRALKAKVLVATEAEALVLTDAAIADVVVEEPGVVVVCWILN